MKILKKDSINIKEGKSYTMRIPRHCYEFIKVHIDYILDNTISDKLGDKLIVVRYWIKSKKYWKYEVYEYYHLQMYNDGRFGKNNIN